MFPNYDVVSCLYMAKSCAIGTRIIAALKRVILRGTFHVNISQRIGLHGLLGDIFTCFCSMTVVFVSSKRLEKHATAYTELFPKKVLPYSLLNLRSWVYCILASCYIRLTLNICSFVRQCNTFTS
jgi:hypothetical protein